MYKFYKTEKLYENKINAAYIHFVVKKSTTK